MMIVLSPFPPFLLLLVYIFSITAYSKPKEGAVCHSAGQCGTGFDSSPAEEAREKKETDNSSEGWPEDCRNS